MGQLRCHFKARVRTAPQTRTGTSKAGKPYTLREVEVMDGDDNKVVLGLRDLDIELTKDREYEFTVDVETDFRAPARVDVVTVKPAVPVRAAAAG